MKYSGDVSKHYRGRFAPSPSGPLHFGSLVCALASYLDAKAQGGTWLVRIEDIDQQRCDPQFSELILDTLAAHSMQSDEPVLVQSASLERYQAALETLISDHHAYACACTRKQIKARAANYDGHCRSKNLPFNEHHAVRLLNQNTSACFHDGILGMATIKDAMNKEDLVLKRADGCFAYNLVVVLDDIYQNISDVVRGADLIGTTSLQMYLHELLNTETLNYKHIPVVASAPNVKLSKQNHAKPIDNKNALSNIQAALLFLGYKQNEVNEFSHLEHLLTYAIKHWQLKNIPKQREFIISSTNDVYSFVINKNGDQKLSPSR